MPIPTTRAPREPLAILRHDPKGRFSISFKPDEIDTLARALVKCGRPVNGYTIEAVLLHLSERGDPSWSSDLHFDSEHDTFVVYCSRKAPLSFLRRRLEKRIADPKMMRLLVKRTPDSVFEGVLGR